MNLRVLGLLALVSALTACQSHHAAMELVCNASTGCPECNAADPATRAMRLAEYLSSHVTNGETAEMLSSLASVAPADRARILRAEASREGLSSCPMADELEAGLSR